MDFSDLIRKASSLQNSELELKLKESKEMLITIASNILKKEKNIIFTRTLAFLGNDGYRMEMDKDTKKTTSIIKKYIGSARNNGDISYTLSLVDEIPSIEKPIERSRAKYRASVLKSSYRIDITLVYQCYENQCNKDIIKDLFSGKMSKDVFITKLNNFRLEIEFEFNQDSYLKSTLDDILKYVEFHIDDDFVKKKYREIIFREVSVLLKSKKAKSYRNLVPKVIELNKNKYYRDVKSKIDEFYLLDKADGVRCILFIKDKICNILTDKIDTMDVKTDDIIICDSEKAGDTFYIFDVLYNNGNKEMRDGINLIDKVAKLSPRFKKKRIIKLNPSNLSSSLKAMKESKEYETDGLIFTDYNRNSFKWKPITHMSVDFLVRDISFMNGVKPYLKQPGKTMYGLFCGISRVKMNSIKLKPIKNYDKLFPSKAGYMPIQFSPINQPYSHIYYGKSGLDGKVCEFRHDTKKWIFMRVRTDRQSEVDNKTYFGNDYYVAEYTFLNYFNPLTFQDLTSEDKSYFLESKTSDYMEAVKYNSRVKELLISSYRGEGKWVADLACGHGQDLMKISRAKFSGFLGVDLDKNALAELADRRHTLTKQGKLKMKIVIHNADLRTLNPEEFVKQIASKGIHRVDAILCNFAIHYFTNIDTHIKNFEAICYNLLKPGGKITITCFDGEKVNKLISSGSWEVSKGGRTIYKITKKYKDDLSADGKQILRDFGQPISVLLPFSNGKEYVEYLVNLKYLTNVVFSRWKKRKVRSFHRILKPDLNEDDKLFTSLYSAITMYR